MWSSTSACATSSSVARKLVTSVCGRLRMKPTVSDRRTRRRLGSSMARSLGSSVANMRDGREHLRAGDRVEERAFAGIGVADESDGGHGNRFAALALLPARRGGRIRAIELELIDAALNAAAIGFELGFAGAASADAAAELRHGFAAAGEARQHVFELGELDLKLAFAGARVAGKNVEDELRAIEDAARQSGLKVAQLRGRQVVIEEDEVGVGGSGDAGDLLDFAGADERGGIGARAALHELGGDLAAGAQKQLAKFGERFFSIKTGCVETRSTGGRRIVWRDSMRLGHGSTAGEYDSGAEVSGGCGFDAHRRRNRAF